MLRGIACREHQIYQSNTRSSEDPPKGAQEAIDLSVSLEELVGVKRANYWKSSRRYDNVISLSRVVRVEGYSTRSKGPGIKDRRVWDPCLNTYLPLG